MFGMTMNSGRHLQGAAAGPASSGRPVAGLTAAAIAATMVCASAMPARAGLLELLFGGAQIRPQVEAPLEMTVRPDRPAKPGYGAGDDIPHIKAVPIDPVAHPDWYLIDPTLRAGDIVVLPQKVLVYNGRRDQRRLADFDELDRSRSLSSRTRERIRALTEYNRGPAVKYTIITAPEQPLAGDGVTVKPNVPARAIPIATTADVNG